MTPEELQAVKDLTAAIKALTERLPAPTGLGGYASPLFTVRCECSHSPKSYPPYLPYAY